MDSRYVELNLKPCTKLWEKQLQTNRLSSLPNELLIRILSLLPTKYAVVVCMLLKKSVLPWLTSLDFDSSPIFHCLSCPNQIERFPSFQTFVDYVLKAHQSPSLFRFRLDLSVSYYPTCIAHRHYFTYGHNEECLPHLKLTQINAWITFPLTRYGLRELDLRIHLRGLHCQSQLPPEVFMKETLEVLKLHVNLRLDGISIFRLPNLKVLHLYASVISKDAFVTNLVSSCPVLKELKMEAWWNHVEFTKISSTSLRSLFLSMCKLEDTDNSDLVVLDTPNLEDLHYGDNVALEYSVTSMPHLVKAIIDFDCPLEMESEEVNCQQFLIFISALSNVRHLLLDGVCPSILNTIRKKKQLPVFHDLIVLELNVHNVLDRNTLMAFLYRSPNLETLVFPRGLGYCSVSNEYDESRKQKLEQEWRRLTLKDNPWCCEFSLKRIVVYGYHGSDRERMYIKFLLKYALVLEELVVVTTDKTVLESTLQNLPRASSTCSIQLHCISGYVYPLLH